MHADSQETHHYYWVKKDTSLTLDPYGGRRWPAEVDYLVRLRAPARQFKYKLWLEGEVEKPEEFLGLSFWFSKPPEQIGWDKFPTLEELKQRVANQVID